MSTSYFILGPVTGLNSITVKNTRYAPAVPYSSPILNISLQWFGWLSFQDDLQSFSFTYGLQTEWAINTTEFLGKGLFSQHTVQDLRSGFSVPVCCAKNNFWKKKKVQNMFLFLFALSSFKTSVNLSFFNISTRSWQQLGFCYERNTVYQANEGSLAAPSCSPVSICCLISDI